MLRAIWFVPPVLTTVAEALHHVPESSHVRSCLTQSSDEQFQALVDETSDFAVTAIDNVFAWNARTPRRDFKVIAQIERTTPLRVISQPQIKAIGDLRGAELLVDSPDNGFVIALRTFLDDHGVTPGSYRLVPAGGVKQRLDALAEGRGDATLLGPPFDTTALSRGFPSLGSINAAYPDFPGQGVVARTSVIDRLSAPLGDWIAAQDKARAWIDDNRDQATSLLLKAGLPPALADTVLQSNPPSLVPDRRGIELLIEQRRRFGSFSEPIGYDDFIDLSTLKASGAWMPATGTRS